MKLILLILNIILFIGMIFLIFLCCNSLSIYELLSKSFVYDVNDEIDKKINKNSYPKIYIVFEENDIVYRKSGIYSINTKENQFIIDLMGEKKIFDIEKDYQIICPLLKLSYTSKL